MNKQFNFFDYHSQISNRNIIISYKGPVTAVILAEISREIRSIFQENQTLSRKVFGVFIELAQNVSYYSTEINHFGETSDKVGTIVIHESDDSYVLTTGNLIKSEDVDELSEKCEIINSLDHDALRAYKREQRNLPPSQKSKGAGIGLIQVALVSNNPLQIEVRKMSNDNSFFAISVTIAKSIQ